MSKETLNIYDLSRAWFDWCFVNTDIVNPAHTAIYFFAIEHCNRLGWKEKFGFPTSMAMEAVGIKKHQTYIKYFNDLCEWGAFLLIQKSANQYSANIITVQKMVTKNGKALDKALIKHGAKQVVGTRQSTGQSTGQSNGSIDIQYTNTQNTNTQVYRKFAHLSMSVREFEGLNEMGFTKEQIDSTLDSIENFAGNGKYTNLTITCEKWLRKDFKPNQVNQYLSVSERQDEEIKQMHGKK